MYKNISKAKIIYMFEFLFFIILILKAPVVGDRWMERNAGVSLEHPLRIIFAQVRWFQIANGRVFSNLFSFLVDGYNIYIRAIINASMLVFISFLINKICSLKTLFGILVPFIVSFGIWIEVYYYATTFYVSAALILISWVYILELDIIDLSMKKKYVLLCLFAFISSMWVENLSILLLCIWGGYYLKKLALHGKGIKYLFIIILGGIGLILMFLSAYFAQQGRLSYQNQQESIAVEILKIGKVLTQEYILFIFLSVVVIRLLCSMINKSKHIYFHIIIWGLTLFLNLIIAVRRIYMIISTDPIDTSFMQHITWIKFDNLFINTFIYEINLILTYLCIIMFPICLLSIYLIINKYCFKQRNQLFILISSNVICFFLTMIFMYRVEDPRVIFIFEIFLGLIICLIYIQQDKKNNNFSKILLIISIIFWCQFAFLEPYSRIFKERSEVAQLVKEKQLIGEWDYAEDLMYLPAYSKNNIGDGLFSNRYNPSVDDVYYTIMLKYYNLDVRTKIIYE